MDEVTLLTVDGATFTVEQEVAEKSKTVKNLIEDAGTDNPIPLPNVTGPVLKKIVAYAEYHHSHSEGDETQAWDQQFFTMEQSDLFELILAANYLDYPELLDRSCQTVADMIKGKTPEEIRTLFNIKCDFSSEELEQARAENSFMLEE